MRNVKVLLLFTLVSFCLSILFICSPEAPDFDAPKRPQIDFNGRIFHREDSAMILGEKYLLYVKMKKGDEPLRFIWRKDSVPY